MTRLISILIIALVLLGAWKLLEYWQKIQYENEHAKKEAAARVVTPDQLPGLPSGLQPSLDAAEQQGPAALDNWLKAYGRYVQDPRLAWIELDYCVMIARSDPNEARRIFAAVRDRTPPASPVWPRIKELEKSYQ
jgi:hypothetical protein